MYRSIIELFGAEDVVTLWSALLTKKRIMVYAAQVDQLLQFVRALPLLVFHRQNWDILRPFVVNNICFHFQILILFLKKITNSLTHTQQQKKPNFRISIMKQQEMNWLQQQIMFVVYLMNL
jgi:hypothetical protein